jgi:hypothetical protein
MTYTAKVTRLNSCQNILTKDVITSFLIENMPAVVQVELLTHGLISVCSESSRARPSASVSDQVLIEPYIPNWTANQKGMSGHCVEERVYLEAGYLTTKHIRASLKFARDLNDLGIHKQDINKTALSPFIFNHVIITATEWSNFLNLRCSEQAHLAMQSIANTIKSLLQEPPENKYSIDRHQCYFTPYPDFETFQGIAKVASVSYANHAKERSPEDALRLVKHLSASKHASPFCMAARPVFPGMMFNYTRMDGSKHKYIVFDNFRKEESAILYAKHVAEGGTHKLLDTDNLRGWMSMRRLEGL